MNRCSNKPKHTCGTRTPSTCVFYDLKVPEYSKLVDESCLSIEETTNDLYNLVTDLRSTLDLTDFDKGCLDITQKELGYDKKVKTFLIKDVLKALKDKICKDVTSSGSGSTGTISGFNNLDFKCLVNPCGKKPATIEELLQLIINKICP